MKLLGVKAEDGFTTFILYDVDEQVSMGVDVAWEPPYQWDFRLSSEEEGYDSWDEGFANWMWVV